MHEESRHVSTVIVTKDHLPNVRPPNTCRPPGRLNKKRVRTEDIGIARKGWHAVDATSNLDGSTCREPLEE
ncbi:hypothetical protein LIPSTDRAFT_67111 [Lipomyces starkeyi NRRL Y-11557]|uniref:Uncharacterized protein n=1 Tax=Lipomyces starkeyi NRRL Y-11557 TaxID=675824 RepID=A0A1E3QF82_LIPST|nr:hypothetical protein LIPSTDRAFT_67111 [Lipomyces starkeyi NRRL Y-11557]